MNALGWVLEKPNKEAIASLLHPKSPERRRCQSRSTGTWWSPQQEWWHCHLLKVPWQLTTKRNLGKSRPAETATYTDKGELSPRPLLWAMGTEGAWRTHYRHFKSMPSGNSCPHPAPDPQNRQVCSLLLVHVMKSYFKFSLIRIWLIWKV